MSEDEKNEERYGGERGEEGGGERGEEIRASETSERGGFFGIGADSPSAIRETGSGSGEEGTEKKRRRGRPRNEEIDSSSSSSSETGREEGGEERKQSPRLVGIQAVETEKVVRTRKRRSNTNEYTDVLTSILRALADINTNLQPAFLKEIWEIKDAEIESIVKPLAQTLPEMSPTAGAKVQQVAPYIALASAVFAVVGTRVYSHILVMRAIKGEMENNAQSGNRRATLFDRPGVNHTLEVVTHDGANTGNSPENGSAKVQGIYSPHTERYNPRP